MDLLWGVMCMAVVVLTIHLPTASGLRAGSEADAGEWARLNELRAREQARTDVAAQREAVEVFHSMFDTPWSYKGVEGTVPLQCGSHSYTGDASGLVQGVGSGHHGVTVLLHRDSSNGPKVVAKIWKGNVADENLNHECRILKLLQDHHVPTVVTCEAACEQNGNIMIIISPFKEGRPRSFIGKVSESWFDSPAAVRQAIKGTLETGFGMLTAGAVNMDQAHNILYGKDGSLLFIDMGLANEVKAKFHTSMFLDALFEKIPPAWWLDGRANEILEEVTFPPDFKSRIREAIQYSQDYARRHPES